MQLRLRSDNSVMPGIQRSSSNSSSIYSTAETEQDRCDDSAEADFESDYSIDGNPWSTELVDANGEISNGGDSPVQDVIEAIDRALSRAETRLSVGSFYSPQSSPERETFSPLRLSRTKGSLVQGPASAEQSPTSRTSSANSLDEGRSLGSAESEGYNCKLPSLVDSWNWMLI